MAERSVSYWARMADECVDSLASDSVMSKFFSTDRAFDRSGMHIEAEFLQQQLRQIVRPDRLAGRKLCSEKSQHVVLNLVRTAGAPLLGYQPRNTPFLEVELCLVIGRARNAVIVGHVRHGRLIDRDAA